MLGSGRLMALPVLIALSQPYNVSSVESQAEKAPMQSSFLVYKVFLVRGTCIGQHIYFIDTQSNAFTATREGIRT